MQSFKFRQSISELGGYVPGAGGQNQGRREIDAGLCQAAVVGPEYARSATEPARAEVLFAKHAPEVEHFGKDKAQGPSAKTG